MKLKLLYILAVYILKNEIDYKKSSTKLPTDLVELLDKLRELEKSVSGIKFAVNNSRTLLDYYCGTTKAPIYASGEGCQDVAREKKEENRWNLALYGASKRGHLEAVKYCEEKGANDWNLALYGASLKGHLEVVKYCEEKGANDWNGALYGASEGGHLEVVKYCGEKGVNAWSGALHEASRGGHLEVVKYCAKKGQIVGMGLCVAIRGTFGCSEVLWRKTGSVAGYIS